MNTAVLVLCSVFHHLNTRRGLCLLPVFPLVVFTPLAVLLFDDELVSRTHVGTQIGTHVG